MVMMRPPTIPTPSRVPPLMNIIRVRKERGDSTVIIRTAG
jgi:hypothetical protein